MKTNSLNAIKTNDLRTFTQVDKPSIFTKLKCHEMIDIQDLEVLMESSVLAVIDHPMNYYQHEKEMLTGIHANMSRTKSKVKTNSTIYNLSKKHSHGRVYPFKSHSVGAMRQELRHTLVGSTYYDIDIENCHPSMLSQIASAEGIECKYLNKYVHHREAALKQIMDVYDVNRYEAKQLGIRMCYGGKYSSWIQDTASNKAAGIIDWVDKLQSELLELSEAVVERNPHLVKDFKHAKNVKASVLAAFAQDVERKVLEVMFNFMVANKFIKKSRRGEWNTVLCFDGIMIPQENVNCDMDDLLSELSAYVQKHTCLNLNFTEKKMEKGYNLMELQEQNENKQDTSVEVVFGKEHNSTWLSSPVGTDKDAGEKVVTIYPHWKYRPSTQDLFVFDDETGMWSTDAVVHKSIVSRMSDYLHTPLADGSVGVKSYGNTKALMDKVFDFIRAVCIDEQWFRDNESSSLKHLLFTNGYMNMDTCKFYSKEEYGFNPDVVFFGRIPRPLVRTEQEDMDELKDKLFYQTLGKEQGDFMITYLARALAGDLRMKKILFGVGVGNSGKGTITKALQLSLGDYTGTFNAGNMAYSNSSNDEAQKLRWAMLSSKCRILISNEVDSRTPLDGNVIKKVASGGDPMIARLHCGNETEFTVHFAGLVLVNDAPKVVPMDDAVNNRLRVVSFEKSYVDKPQNKFEMLKDDTFCESIHTTKSKDTLLAILCRAYIDFMDGGGVMYEPDIVLKARDDWMGDSKGIVDQFFEEYEVDESDVNDAFVSNEQIEEWLIGKKSGYTIRRFNKELTRFVDLAGNSKRVKYISKKVNGKVFRGFSGVRLTSINLCEVVSGI